jgi:hypothetical protein
MNKSTLALAVAVGVMAQQAGAAGFIEDSKATLGLRNFYINTITVTALPAARQQDCRCSEQERRVGPSVRSALHLRLHPRHRRFRYRRDRPAGRASGFGRRH